ncbi:hypothetical protein PR048_031787 [Dryococelus australis]|uniref:Uncharacterized protein n=1 Tax=Dryococelus australis TaxID=614101 RepID=A0ABQ9G6W0_9NEOP|nr:hypothetical protein PR048_031787 [Dryococelus australis]
MHLKTHCSDYIKLYLFMVLIIPFFDYCDIVYSAHTDVQYTRLQKLSNIRRPISFIFNLKALGRVSPYYSKLSWLRFYKSLFFNPVMTSTVVLMSNMALLIPRYRTCAHPRSFSVTTSRVGNAP